MNISYSQLYVTNMNNSASQVSITSKFVSPPQTYLMDLQSDRKVKNFSLLHLAHVLRHLLHHLTNAEGYLCQQSSYFMNVRGGRLSRPVRALNNIRRSKKLFPFGSIVTGNTYTSAKISILVIILLWSFRKLLYKNISWIFY